MIHGGDTLIAKGNVEWAAIGHPAAYTFNGTDYLIFHGYNISDEGKGKLVIKEINWTDGGPTFTL